MYFLKQNIKYIYKNFFHLNLTLYERECKILDNALKVSETKKELKENLKGKLGYCYNEKINEYLYDKIKNNKKSIIKLLKNINIKDEKKILFYYKFFIFKGWLVESYYLRQAYLKLKKSRINNSLNIIEKNNLSSHCRLYNHLKKHTEVNQKLKKLICSKKVAIVGPALSDQINGKEIDKFDIVVRINQIDRSNLSTKVKGKKTDIIFLNGTKSEQVIKEKRFNFLKKAKAIIFKTDGYIKYFKNKGFINTYKNINIDNYMLVGISNILPYALFQILLCEPTKIKIFDNDFMINPKRVKNYEKHNLDQRTNFLRIIFLHDPLSQFNFVRLICNATKIIKGEKKFTKAIKLDQKEFLSKLENSYDLH